MGIEYFTVIIFIIGLLLGSFVNVIIYRVPLSKSIVSPPSTCTSCGTRLKPTDLIPVFSWFFLRGKCRYCKEPVSFRYPLVELIYALVFTVIYIKFGLSASFLAYAFLMLILTAIFFIDLEYMIIPNGLVIVGLIGGAIVFIYNIFRPGEFLYGDNSWWTPIAGMFSASVLLLLVAVIGMTTYQTEDAIGMGDVKIYAPIGLFLGWKLGLLSLFISVILGGIAGVILIILRKKDRKDAVAFGPFIVFGTFISIIWGWEIIAWYFGLL